jgi:hypothetical protein
MLSFAITDFRLSTFDFEPTREAWKKRSLLPKNKVDSNVHASLLFRFDHRPLTMDDE